MPSRKVRALASWTADVIESVITASLLYGWTSDLRSGRAEYLSPSFFRDGFCLSPQFENTHLVCSIFDIVGGLGLIILSASLGNVHPKNWLPLASYLFFHGYGHYIAGTELESGAGILSAKEILVMAAILSIGPLQGAEALLVAGVKNKNIVYGIAMLILSALVSVYALIIRKPNYALLYINVTILLTSSFPRALAVGYRSEEHISIRIDKPYFYALLLSRMFVVAMVFLEPFFCDTFVAKAGGHLLFDISLFSGAIIGIMPSQKEPERKKVM